MVVMQRMPGPRLPVWVQTVCYGLRPVPFLEWCHRRYGDTFAVRLPGGGTMLVLADPVAIRQVFALGPEEFSAAAGAAVLEPFLGRGSLLFLDGERHTAERKLLARGLHAGLMSDYAHDMREATLADMATWPVGVPLRLHPHMQAVTLDVIVRLILGADSDAARDGLIRVLVPWLRQDAGSVVLLWEPLRRDFRGHGPWASFVARRAVVHEWLERLIACRRADTHVADRRDVCSLLIAHGHLDDLSLRDELMTMLTAGHDTTATALAWAFVLILRHPRVLDRLLAELETGDDTYLDAVVKEVLRLSPVVLELGRALTRDTTIAGIRVPAGVALMPSILLAQRRPDRYDQPLGFQPERFLEGPPEPDSWLPFGGGIRRCIGAAFATLEIKTVLRTVLTHAQLEPVGRMETARRRAVTLIPSRGAQVKLTARLAPSTEPTARNAQRATTGQ
jgi:cytochrome P450 family 135